MGTAHGSIPPTPPAEPAVSEGTARFIARNLWIASLTGNAGGLLPGASGPLLRRWLELAGDGRFVRRAKRPLFRAVFKKAVDLVLPGVCLHYLARKRSLEDWVRRACHAEANGPDGGCRQVVVLGAGLDTLAWRRHRQQPNVHFFELDRPAALRVKERALADEGTRPENLHLLPADLGGETLTQALSRAPAFDPTQPTLFLAEGLLMYLPPERVRSLLGEAAALDAGRGANTFAFTFMEAREDGRIRFRRSHPLVDWWLRWQGEPFRWSCDPPELAAFLRRTGWRLDELVSGDDLRLRYLQPAGLRDARLAMGEWLALARTKGGR